MELPKEFVRLAVGFSVYDQADNGNYPCTCDQSKEGRGHVHTCTNCRKVIEARDAMQAGLTLLAGAAPGSTGAFPDGRIHVDDEGELAMAVIADGASGNVVLDFGKSITWTAFEPAFAREFAALLLAKAAELENLPPPPDH